MITIYGIYNSRAARTLWLARELGLEFRHVPVIQKGKLADPLAEGAPLNTGATAFLEMCPAGYIPCVDDDGLVLFETGAIGLHLARKAGGPLAPKDAAEDALMTQWSFYASTAVEPAALRITLTHRGGTQASPEGKAVIDAAKTELRRPLAVLEQHLAKQDWLVGDRFTLADIQMAECLRYADPERAYFAEFPALLRWYEACQARPAFAEMMAARAAE